MERGAIEDVFGEGGGGLPRLALKNEYKKKHPPL